MAWDKMDEEEGNFITSIAISYVTLTACGESRKASEIVAALGDYGTVFADQGAAIRERFVNVTHVLRETLGYNRAPPKRAHCNVFRSAHKTTIDSIRLRKEQREQVGG